MLGRYSATVAVSLMSDSIGMEALQMAMASSLMLPGSNTVQRVALIKVSFLFIHVNPARYRWQVRRLSPMEGGRRSLSPPSMGERMASLCSPWSSCRLCFLQLFDFCYQLFCKASCPLVALLALDSPKHLPCFGCPLGGTLTVPCCWVLPWMQEVGLSF